MNRRSSTLSASAIRRAGRVLLALLSIGGGLYFGAAVHAAPGTRVQLNVEAIGPRPIEEQTEKAVVRDYGAAWAALGQALEQNRSDQLGDLWVGFAKQKFMAAIDQQKQSGLRVRYLDKGHQLDGVFYSPEGSALELHDTAQLRRQVLDGDAVVYSEDITAHYLVVMTPTSDHWQVRILQSAPKF